MAAKKYTLSEVAKAVAHWGMSPVPERNIQEFLARQERAKPENQCLHNNLERFPNHFKCTDCKVKFRRSAA